MSGYVNGFLLFEFFSFRLFVRMWIQFFDFFCTKRCWNPKKPLFSFRFFFNLFGVLKIELCAHNESKRQIKIISVLFLFFIFGKWRGNTNPIANEYCWKKSLKNSLSLFTQFIILCGKRLVTYFSRLFAYLCFKFQIQRQLTTDFKQMLNIEHFSNAR